MEFYICKHCGNIIGFAKNTGVSVYCCGEEMTKIVPNTMEASVEKHIPQVEVNGNKVRVTVGSTLHPMEEGHHIAWVAMETEQGNQRKPLNVNGEPVIEFAICEGDRVKNVYAYCNLHGLWKKEM